MGTYNFLYRLIYYRILNFVPITFFERADKFGIMPILFGTLPAGYLEIIFLEVDLDLCHEEDCCLLASSRQSIRLWFYCSSCPTALFIRNSIDILLRSSHIYISLFEVLQTNCNEGW